jgi:Putative restriction endonuclease
MLVSDLVLPLAFAQTPGRQTLPRFGVRLANDTCLRGDVVVAERSWVPVDGWYVDGPPLLVVEVLSAASAHRDLGPKKDLLARFGVPALWVVEPVDRLPTVTVFELEGGELVERARLSGDTPYLVTWPFEMKLVPEEIFEQLGMRPAGRTERTDNPDKVAKADRAGKRGKDRAIMTHTDQTGADLPPAEQKILIDSFGFRWPTGAEKVELWDGCPVFYGVWDERDVEIAARAYPGRIVRLDQEPGRPGTLRVLPAEHRDHEEHAHQTGG